MKCTKLFIFLLFFSPTVLLPYGLPGPILRWDWSQIPYQDEDFLRALNFPRNFQFGVADSAYQVEGTYNGKGHVRNNWTAWEDNLERNPSGLKAGIACDRWRSYREDIQLIHDAGFSVYRFSIDWSKVEPEEGVFDDEVMRHYSDVIDEVINAGIEPIVCLFHQIWPLWFDEKGAFEHEKNNEDFVRFCTYVFQHLHTKVRHWMILNEPTAYSMASYFTGTCPPHKKNLKLTGIVLKNLLDCHIAAVKGFRMMDAEYDSDNLEPLQFTLAKVFHPIDPYHWWHPIEKLAAFMFDRLVNTIDLEYFRTGKFKWGFPGWTYVYGENEGAIGSLDYLGVNYYSHTNIRFFYRLKKIMTPYVPDEVKTTDKGTAIYPEGLYRAIQRASVLGIPMVVTENGVPDATDSLKEDFINQHLYAIRKAIADGYDVRGYHYWTFMDTYGWNSRLDSKYGLYEVNFDTQERTLRPKAQPFIEFVQSRRR